MVNVAVIGTGYVGLVTGACLSELGHNVVCIDTNDTKIARLREGEIPIYEPGLEELVAANAASGLLSFTTDVREAVARGIDILFIAVGTPTDGSGGGADLRYVYAAVEQAARAIAARAPNSRDFTVIVTKSTVPVGTSRKIAAILAEHIGTDHFAVASNPEFLREGSAIADFMEPDRIVVGSHSERARTLLEQLYMPLTRKGRPLVVTSTVETAELIKYAANAFLATKVTFINELARLCELAGADVKELALGVGMDNRIGPMFFTAGPGFGGSCFPKDLRALVKTANDFGSPVEIVETVIRANDRHKQMMVEKIREALGGSFAAQRIGILGLAFKANTDDMRDAPALTIVPELIAGGAELRAYDPTAAHQARELLPQLQLADSVEDVAWGADAVVVLTEWSQFRTIAWRKLIPTMRRPLVIDLRNIFDTQDMLRQGVEYLPLGRGRAELAYRAAAE
jgi:UDPglucose 6-dehydrogenase